MNTSLSFIAIPLLGLQFLYVEKNLKPCEKVDLEVVQVTAPEYNSSISGSTFYVVIKNSGLKASQPCTITAGDLDISEEDVMKISNDSSVHFLIAENNSRAAWDYEKGDPNIDSDKNDYDTFWNLEQSIPSLESNQEMTLTFDLEHIWLYNANCEIIVEIKPHVKDEDCDLENNVIYFFDWG